MAAQVEAIDGESIFEVGDGNKITTALVRAGCELDTDKVEELGLGVKVTAVERRLNAKGAPRLRITAPVAGWLSEKCVTPFIRYDLLVVGPNGVVGQILCKLLRDVARDSNHPLRLDGDAVPTWAVAGRTRKTVERVAKEYKVAHFVVDEKKPATWARAVDSAKVVLTCAGPYREKGPRLLLAACAAAAHNVAYFDLTGEWLLVADVIKKHGAEAAAKGNALVQMAGPQEILTTELAAHLAVERLKARGRAAPFLEVLTYANAAMSGGSVASGTAMQLEESRDRLDDPWSLTADQDVAGRAAVPALYKDDCKEASHDARWGDGIYVGPAPLGTGDARSLRRTAHALGWPGAEAAAGVRMYTILPDMRTAKYMVQQTQGAPEMTLKAIERGLLPARGVGPTAAQSYGTAFTDVVVAHADAATTTDRGDAPVAACTVRAPSGVGYGIGCGYAGSAYCLALCGLAALKSPPKAGAGLTPLTAFGADSDLLPRLRNLGYEFDVADALPTGEALAEAFKLAKAGDDLKLKYHKAGPPAP